MSESRAGNPPLTRPRSTVPRWCSTRRSARKVSKHGRLRGRRAGEAPPARQDAQVRRDREAAARGRRRRHHLRQVGEAEALADGGITDILIATQIVGPLKLARLVELAGRCTVTVAVDDADNVRRLSVGRRGGRRHPPRLRRGERGHGPLRRGTGEPALALARQVDAAEGLVFAGLQAYEGHLQNLLPFEERAARTRADMRKALTAKEHIEAAGLQVGALGGCGTGTHTITGRLPWMTELQCGSYATMDAQYAAVGGADYENALTVLTTVISRRARQGRSSTRASRRSRPSSAIRRCSWRRDLVRLLRGARRDHGRRAGAGAASRRQDRTDPPARMHHGEPLRHVPRRRGRRARRRVEGRRARSLPVDGHAWRGAARGRCQ